jgi:acetyl-CoA synthetase
LQEREAAFDMMAAQRVEEFSVYPTVAESPSVLHYTSGTTGQPKGAQHVHYSVISQYLTTKWVLDLHEDDIYWCNADPGWVTGTSYGIIGPWSNGATQVVFDSGFNAARWYDFIEKYKVTVWYSAPTAIRLLMKEGKEPARSRNLSSLRHLASVGEPLNAEAVIWSGEVFGHQFHDTFWQTETGCIVITNFPGMPIKPGSMGKPFPGITAAILNPTTYERAWRRRLDRSAPGVAVADSQLLEQSEGIRIEVQERLVPVRRPCVRRSRRLLLVHGPRRRRYQHRRAPGRALRDRICPARTPCRR